jgi:phosphoribosyl 1,2-cyclic phosphodiesterase/DNA-binding response OmpR family regulator
MAKPGPDTIRYGGNTSCVQITSAAGTLLIIDCGTGAHGLGQMLLKEGPKPTRGHVLISHTHWDHIQGIPFFAPFFIPGNKWDFYAPKGFGESLRETLAGQMEYTYFPITPEAFGAELNYNNLSEGVFRIDDVVIRTRYLNHPALTIAFRIEVDGAVVVYACDHEPHSREAADGTSMLQGQDLQHAEFLRDADLVIHDAQYLASEYAGKIGWGHSTVEYSLQVCKTAGVKQLAITHHDPMRSDDAIDVMIDNLRGSLGADATINVFAAAEGMILDYSGDRVSLADGDEALMDQAVGKREAIALLVSQDHALHAKMKQAVADEPVLLRHVADPASIAADGTQPSLLLIDGSLPSNAIAAATLLRSKPDMATVPILFLGGTAPELGNFGEHSEWLRAPFSVEYARSRIRTWTMRGAFRWLRASIPENETERMQALRALNLVESSGDEQFNRYTRIAAALFKVPYALVSIVDEDRQWFKAKHGTDIEQTPRDVSFCAHAIHHPDVMVVNDALSDSRFGDNPTVNGPPNVRFYAGTPLKLPSGHAIGTLCILDDRPRIFSEEDRARLADLGGLLERELAAIAA